MENETNAVETMLTESVQDDAAQAQGESLSEMLENAAEETQAQEAMKESPKEDAGWIKGRINKAVAKAVAETEARLKAQYEQMLAPIRESVLERKAQELVDSGEFKTLSVAKEYLELKGGMPVNAPEQPQEQPEQKRDRNGRFAPKNEQPEVDPELNARADVLAKQANRIKTKYGVDVMGMFNSDPDIKQKVLAGEWDFYDVAETVMNEDSRVLSAPVRSSNGGSVSRVSIMGMSAEQFKRLNDNLDSGIRYDVRR